MRNASRLIFLDNIRYFVILFVVLQHVALIYGAYQNVGAFSRSLFSLIVTLTDVFMMPIMFFIAGYFALPSIQRHGTIGFIRGKIKRIWLPWLAGVTLLIPVSLYFMYYDRTVRAGDTPMRYFPYWLNFMKDAARFHTGYIPSPDQFTHRNLWFLSNLFVFFIVFAAVYEILRRKRGAEKIGAVDPVQKSFSVVTVLLGATVIAGAAFYGMSMVYNWGYKAIMVVDLIHFEPTRLMFYIVYFPMGVYAFTRGWFVNGDRTGGLKIWLPICLILLFVYSYLSVTGILELTAGTKIFLSMMKAFLCLSIFAVLLSFGISRWNRPTPAERILARDSYTVYIIHYPIHAAMAAALVGLNIHVLFRAGIMYVVTVAGSYIISEYVVRRTAAGAVTAIILINIAMLVLM